MLDCSSLSVGSVRCPLSLPVFPFSPPPPAAFPAPCHLPPPKLSGPLPPFPPRAPAPVLRVLSSCLWPYFGSGSYCLSCEMQPSAGSTIWLFSCFTVALCSRFLGFEFRFSGCDVRCGSFCLVCWEVLHFCTKSHKARFIFCFSF